MARDNNFDQLRTLAALAVVVSHSFILANGRYDYEPIFMWSQGQTTGGGLAVLVFFVLSGYLITQSYLRAPDLRRFVAARLSRILPGLAVAVLATALVLGPLRTTLSAAAYFAAPDTYLYIVGNISLLYGTDALPGLFAANPFPHAVNGSLWTLRHEAACYAIVVALGVARLLTRHVVLVLFLAGLAALALGGNPHSGAAFVTEFLAGSALYLWRPRWRPGVVWLCAAGALLSLLLGGFKLVSATAGAYLIVWCAVGASARLPDLSRWGDLSYGIYIYAFPVQQLVVSQLAGVSWTVQLAVSLPLIVGLSALSWHLVEKQAMRRRLPALRGEVDGAAVPVAPTTA